MRPFIEAMFEVRTPSRSVAWLTLLCRFESLSPPGWAEADVASMSKQIAANAMRRIIESVFRRQCPNSLPFSPPQALRRAAVWHPVAVIGAKPPRIVLGQGVAVALAVGGAYEGRDNLQIPFLNLKGLLPQVGESRVDVQLE